MTFEQEKASRRNCLKALLSLAERVGFEPTVRCRITGFQDRLLKPLGHLSVLNAFIIAGRAEAVKKSRSYGILNFSQIFLCVERYICYNNIYIPPTFLVGGNMTRSVAALRYFVIWEEF